MSKPSSAVPSVILLSGGLDSSANLAFACARDTAVLALHADYGQRAEASEWKAAERLAAYYGVRLEKLDLRWLGALGGSSLTERARAVPELAASELDELPRIRETAQAVWVPNRNGVLIQAAAAYAERLGARRVVVGFNREEATTFPDNTQDFLERSTHALELSTRNGVEVHCYTTAWDKTEIIENLKSLPKRFPHELVWSCYHSGEAPCGKCESCGRRARALASAGIEVRGESV